MASGRGLSRTHKTGFDRACINTGRKILGKEPLGGKQAVTKSPEQAGEKLPGSPNLLVGLVKGGIKSFQMHRLEKDIGRALELCDGHRDKGIKRGDPRYQSLWRIVHAQVEDFCRKHQVEEQEIEAQVPGLQTLKTMATPVPVTRTPPVMMIVMPVAVLVGLVISVAALAFLKVLVSGTWNHVVQWFAR